MYVDQNPEEREFFESVKNNNSDNFFLNIILKLFCCSKKIKYIYIFIEN